MEEKTLEVLEFPEILNKVKDFARSKLVKDEIMNIRPITNPLYIKDELEKTEQMIMTIEEFGNIDLFGLYDFKQIIEYVRKKGILEPSELLKVLDFLRSSKYLIEYGENVREDYIKKLFDRLFYDDFLRSRIENSIINEEEISDNASSDLRSIRKKMAKKELEIKDKLNYYVSSPKFDDALQDKVVTIRDGRYVLPVKSNKKSVLNGIIHDKSQSGNTIFIEPSAIVELNNQYADLELLEREEIRRVLDELSRMVESYDEEILENQKYMARIDYLQAKSKYALANGHSKPIITEEKRIELKSARHPLLKGKVVPIDVKIGGDYTTLIITGPNTGGKTVSLKTVGLICAMAQSGLFIPTNDESKLFVFDNIFLDIGDTQSIEMSLSTFSASLNKIVDLLDKVSENSLVLLDEIGSGTDPVEGAALARAILNYLTQRKVMTFATTHYSELKYYAVETDGVMNASVQFDVETLSPTYKLEIGIPGKSNAFEISKRLGLKQEILDYAEGLLGEDEVNMNSVLAVLDDNKKELEEKNQEIDNYKKEIEKNKNLISNKLKEMEEEKNRLVEEAKDKANEILENANLESQEMLKEAKKSKNANTSDIDRTLNNIRNKYKSSKYDRERKSLEKGISKNSPENLKVGDTVLIAGLNEKAEVIEAPDEKGNIKVRMGILKMDANIKNVTKIEDEDLSQKLVKKVYNAKKAMNISPTLDLRGQRYDEALRNFDKYIDDAMLSNLSEVKIIHGKGTGALRNGITDYLKNNKRIKSYRYGDDKEGGFGVTIVSLK